MYSTKFGQLFKQLCLVGLIGAATPGCGSDDDPCDSSSNNYSCPEQRSVNYAFDSRFNAAESSVAYDGQVVRHLLISDMMHYLEQLTERIDRGDFVPQAGQVADDLNFYLSFDLETVPNFSTALLLDLPLLQSRYADLSSPKNLLGKLAGNDPVGQHRDWIVDGLVGTQPSQSPEALINTWIDRIDTLAVARTMQTPTDPTGRAIEHVYVSPEGLDYRTLLHRFLLGAVAYSQAADDYLGHDTEGKGLLSDNSVAEEDEPYTALEHSWDEAFGYFGLNRDGSSTYADTNEDGKIDLMSEYSVGDAVLSAALNNPPVAGVPRYKTAIFNAFVQGRQFITDSPTDPSSPALGGETLNQLLRYCETILTTWDEALRHSIVVAIDDLSTALDATGTNAYRFETIAERWSHAYATLLSLQFNSLSAISKGDIADSLDLLGQAPPRLADELSEYQDNLADARDIVARDLPLGQ